jgi:hypothetical protein
MNRSLALPITAALLLVATVRCCVDSDWEPFFPPTRIPAVSTREPGPTTADQPVGGLEAETEALLSATSVPARDLHALAIRLRGMPSDTARTINPEGSPDYPVGTRRLFHVYNTDTDQQHDVSAILEYKTEHVYMWIEEGAGFDRTALQAAAGLFEEHTYPTNRAFFGSEWSPGVDNDPHISILHARNLGLMTLGFFYSPSEYVSAVREDSNEMEMFYINLDRSTINSDQYHSTLAHEFQHMIHWYNDNNEEAWLNEGLSQLASSLNGLDPGGHHFAFAGQPDNQLTDLDYDAADYSASYGAGYLFTAYFLDRFGSEATQALVADRANGVASADAILADLGTGMTHEDLFGDWVVANLLNDPAIGDGRYGYEGINPPTFYIETSYDESEYPVSGANSVHQYGTDYVELRGQRPLLLQFAGSTQVRLTNAAAHSGSYAWWSNRGDSSSTTLTRDFDLSDTSKATLEFWTWFDIEENWDYAYVEISTDGGQTWTILTTPSGTDANPTNNSFGWAYTGRSGGGGTPEWIQERVDMSAYVGQRVLVRFEYVTDDAVNRPGFVVDDLVVHEIGYASNFEEGDDGWVAAGFIRHANVLPQRWLVQLILFGPETVVQRQELDDDMIGEWIIPLDSDTNRAVIAISGLAPVTTETASYSYKIEESP